MLPPARIVQPKGEGLMYIDSSGRKTMTRRRPRVEKRTVSLPETHHILENILANSSVRKALLWMTRRDAEGKCFFTRLCENYENPEAGFWRRLKWSVPGWAIDLAIWKTGLNRETRPRAARTLFAQTRGLPALQSPGLAIRTPMRH